MLEKHGIEVIRHPLPDHARILAADLAFDDELDVMMTEKDAVKCRHAVARNCWYVPVDVSIDRSAAEEFIDRLVASVSGGERGATARD